MRYLLTLLANLDIWPNKKYLLFLKSTCENKMKKWIRNEEMKKKNTIALIKL